VKLRIKKTLDKREIVHYADAQKTISSFHDRVYIDGPGGESSLRLPGSLLRRAAGSTRIGRRGLRLDKCNAFPVRDELIVVRQGVVYHHDPATEQLTPTLTLQNCRNALHQSGCLTPEGSFYFGEYGMNPERRSVPIYRTDDAGRSWQTIFEFKPGEARHVHGCLYDKYEDRIWVCTGDFKDENWIVTADRDFKDVEKIGDGQQYFRTCSLFFTADHVHWIMDSQLEQNYSFRLDRKTRQVERIQEIPGPVWYVKALSDGYYLAATAQERGDGVNDEFAHLLVSRDLERWQDLHLFRHDGLSMRYLKSGVIGFADGEQSSKEFYLFFEAIEGHDGRAVQCAIEDDGDDGA